MVEEGHRFERQIMNCYNNFRYNQVAQTVLFFISNKVSGLYCHCIKDRLYCSSKSSNERLSAQLVMHTILVSICRALGPILPHLIEEAWSYHPLYENPFYFTKEIPVLAPKPIEMTPMDAILDIKKDVCLRAKNENLKKLVLNLKVDSTFYEKFNTLNATDEMKESVLCEIFEVSAVNLTPTYGGKREVILSQSKKSQCMRCRKYNAADNSDKCLRCEKVLASL